ncbi:hypothetical protein BRARA_I03609 [Brassica rapa]|uniref:DUF4283 domain-containing protein n=1 Tax=Brassica campestris TaxID=3711 RepID=A0A397Y028_BRACM|nr:hypothetical protein BRARA_I03609 [Brassica rapa]
MARRYSATEKAKGIVGPSAPVRRIQIPDTDTSALIEMNKLTLIGRVSNPAVQNTRALVDFFLQHWQVSGSVTGRELGPYLFQFSFESEKDLQSILLKGPYHFKRWMFMLQRWEPIVSESFPSLISFWIRILGIPLHYWNEQALEAIGSGLGHVESKDVPNGRVRVTINGLLPLETRLEISLPSGENAMVELEYEKLEKHCFLCSSLSHDKDSCPSALNDGRRLTPVGINQVRTTERLVDRRRAEPRRERTDRQHLNSRLGPNNINQLRPSRERDDRVSRRDLPHHDHMRNQLSRQSSSYRSEPRSERWVPKRLRHLKSHILHLRDLQENQCGLCQLLSQGVSMALQNVAQRWNGLHQLKDSPL